MIETWFARTWIVLAAGIVLGISILGFMVAVHYYRDWRAGVASGKFNDLSTNFWVALIVGTLLDVVLFAVLDVGQALVLVTEGWGGIVGICATVLLPMLGYKAMTKVVTPKGGQVDTSNKEG